MKLWTVLTTGRLYECFALHVLAGEELLVNRQVFNESTGPALNVAETIFAASYSFHYSPLASRPQTSGHVPK